jgi:hypothetical protein
MTLNESTALAISTGVSIIITFSLIALDSIIPKYIIKKRFFEVLEKYRGKPKEEEEIWQEYSDIDIKGGIFGPELGVAAISADISALSIAFTNSPTFDAYQIELKWREVIISLDDRYIFCIILISQIVLLLLIIYTKHLYIDPTPRLANLHLNKFKYTSNILGFLLLISSLYIIIGAL